MPTLTDEEVFGEPQQEQSAAAQPKKYLSDEEVFGSVEAAPQPSYADQAKNKVASFMTGVGKGVPFGQDIPAAIGATLSSAGLMPGSKTIPEQGTWGERFDAAKRAQQEAYERTSKENPYTSGLGTVTGAVGSMPALGEFSIPVEAAGARIGETIAKPLYNAAEKMVANKIPFSSIPKTLGWGAKEAGVTGGHLTSGAGTGALYGLGEGTTLDERLKNAKEEAKFNAIAGAVIPRTVSLGKKITGFYELTPAEQAAEALDARLSASVSTQNPVTKMLSRAYSVSPYVGDVISKGVESGKERLGEAVMEKLKHPSGITAQSGLHPSIVGQDLKTSLSDWIMNESKALEKAEYDKFEPKLNAGSKRPLTNLQVALNDANNRRAAALIGEDSKLNKLLKRAAEDPQGLDYFAAKDLRTYLGQFLEKSVLKKNIDSATSQNLYGALSEDLKNIVTEAGKSSGYGGPRALRDFEAATLNSEQLRDMRQRLGQVVGDIKASKNLGVKGGKEDIQIFNMLSDAAKGRGRSNVPLLKRVKDTLTPKPTPANPTPAPSQDWENLVSRVTEDLGNKNNAFSTRDFVKNYYNMDNQTKDLFYGPMGSENRKVVEDAYKVAQEYEKYGQGKNFSRYSMMVMTSLGLGLPIAGTAAVFGAVPAAVTALGAGAISYPIAKMLSNPRFGYAYNDLMRGLAKLGRPSDEEARAYLQNAIKNANIRQFHEYKMEKEREREKHRTHYAAGGAVGKRDYPARRLTKIEKALKKAQDAIALETKSLMKIPDAQIAQALDIAKDN
jgi:hypothetical protein